MALKAPWITGVVVAAVAVVGAGAAVMSKPAGASPTITVYKTPT